MFNSIIVTQNTNAKTDWVLEIDGQVLLNGRFSVLKENMKRGGKSEVHLNFHYSES